jgi:hypothetical protein
MELASLGTVCRRPSLQIIILAWRTIRVKHKLRTYRPPVLERMPPSVLSPDSGMAPAKKVEKYKKHASLRAVFPQDRRIKHP